MVLWHPPDAPWVKLNTDGVFSSTTLEAGEGGLVRGTDGDLLRAFYSPVDASSSFEAELMALIRGLEMAMEFSTHIWIELDSAALVTLMSSGQPGSADSHTSTEKETVLPIFLQHLPDAPWVKLNTDGVFSTSTMEAGEGGLVRGSDVGLLRAFYCNDRPI
ncbi:uncharacterized protein LOC125194962 [Salvia hispanica]|uniref:uncharacterized protein LOC125194962 n=1 Tax=Salvia hispanica TaxID=49212 RepID=UPI0020091562|nr:uncharacterized protein LOC125194962 [Salvia hispanica]